MKIITFIKPGLFIYECVRIMIFISILILQRNDPGIFTKMIFAAPIVLFPLMALFIWLDTDKYRAYLPLFIAGKSIGIFILLGWSIISRQVTIVDTLSAAAFAGNLTVSAQVILLSGDFFALAAALLIIRDIEKAAEIQSVEEN